MGYQRLFSGTFPYAELPGYEYLLFTSFNPPSSATGAHTILIYPSGGNMSYLDGFPLSPGLKTTGISNATLVAAANQIAWPPENFNLYNSYYGTETINVVDDVSNTWTLTTTGGIATGSVIKGGYPSRAWLFNGVGTPLASEATTSGVNFNFTSSSSNGYMIGIQSPIQHIFYNTSVMESGIPTTSPTQTPTTTPSDPNATTMWFVAMDATSHAQIATLSTVGIKNISSGVWRNTTNQNGLFYVSDTGATHEYTIKVGQSIGVDISANGYVDTDNQASNHSYHAITVESRSSSNPYPIYLTKTTDVTYDGTWNLNAIVTDYTTGKPVGDATLTLITGLNGWCTNGCSPNTKYDSLTGTYGFHNVTSSTIASLTIVAQNYNTVTDTITISSPSNYTTTKYYKLVPKNAVITTTTTSSGGTTTTAVTTVGTMVQPTDAYGNVITDSTEKGIAAIGLLVDAVYVIMGIAVGCLLIWLMWMVVYLITGGKIIDKIMRRGRGGRK